MASYKEMKEQNQKKVNEFTSKNCIWDYSRRPIEQILEDKGWDKDTEIAGFCGGIIKKSAIPLFEQMQKEYLDSVLKEMKENFDFAVNAFETEMYNYEYCFNQDDEQIVGLFGMTVQETIDAGLSKAFMKAKENCLKNSRF